MQDGSTRSLGMLGFVSGKPEGEGGDARGSNGISFEKCSNYEQYYFQRVIRQIVALTSKNLILALRNRTATFLRLFSSCFFILLIFLVNEGLISRYAADPYFKDYPSPPKNEIDGIPLCTVKYGITKCITFLYSPAPDTGGGFRPDRDFTNASTLMDATNNVSCTADQCPEMFRVHRLIRSIMTGNILAGKPAPIPASSVLGFMNSTGVDSYISQHPGMVQGAYIFAAASETSMTFAVQINSTSEQVRGVYTRPYISYGLPMQVQASRAAARLINESLDLSVAIQPFAHPPQPVPTFEAEVAPIFLIGCAMFPFVIQMGEVVAERELKLRQALTAMGLHELAYWLSWHLYQSIMALLFGFFVYAFGCIFQLSMFLDNDFGVVFLTFWLFGQAMVGLAFFIGAFLKRSVQAVTAGFAVFLVGFVLYFMISFAGFPYGTSTTAPFSYDLNITTNNLTMKTSSDIVWEPLFAFAPPTLLIKAIADMGTAAATVVAGTGTGITFSQAYSYCKLQNNCDPNFSVGRCWGWFIGLYILYSTLGLYFENVLPDAMGVRKRFWYFLLPSYWGLGTAKVHDAINVVEPSVDEDVVAEEQEAQRRLNSPMAAASAIEIRGLRATFSRHGKEFHAVKAPWLCIAKRQLFALLGPNGAGKTTTINMLTGFLPPSSGNAPSVVFLNFDVGRLVFNETVAHSSGMSKIRSLMGVCPQFDILWDGLSAKEHLVLFATIKGVRADAVKAEADRLLEVVRLSDTGTQGAGTFSGGMKRRLSVAVALVGSPEVVYLDEPTTGMDPINRRHVWDVLEATKQDRCVILTTHSMEEADILGDRIGIMAKGRLRCIGTSVRLKTRLGEGYRVSVSCGDNMRPTSRHCVKVKDLFKERLGAKVSEETKAYMHFAVPATPEDQMATFFAELERRRTEFGVMDVQLSMSTLEDVFLKVATTSELEEAVRSNRTVAVTLKSGEEVAVLVGCQDEFTSPLGTVFSVRWGTDENGHLIPVDVVEPGADVDHDMITVTCPSMSSTGEWIVVEHNGAMYKVQVPEGVTSGEEFRIQVPRQEDDGEFCQVPILCPQNARPGTLVQASIDGMKYEFEVPEGVASGQEFYAEIPACNAIERVVMECPRHVSAGQAVEIRVDGTQYEVLIPGGVGAGDSIEVLLPRQQKNRGKPQRRPGAHMSQDELRERVEKLRTPFSRQADALFRKNIQFQWNRRVTNGFLIVVPALVLALIFGIQQALDVLVLGGASVRCPYCGPATDSFGQMYCNGASSCAEFFFPNSTWATLLAVYGVDVVGECQAMAGLGPNGTNNSMYCYGNGNVSCYTSQWATSSQSPYCPITSRDNILVIPSLGLAPTPGARAKASVLYTSSPTAKDFADVVAQKTVSTHEALRPKMLGAMRETNRQLFLFLMGIPELGCRQVAPTVVQQQAMCKLLQHGAGTDGEPCCIDFTGNSRSSVRSPTSIGAWQSGTFTGTLRFGVNYWTDTPSLHNDTFYNTWMAKCKSTKGNSVGTCNQQLISMWLSFSVPAGQYGLRLGSGSGQYKASMELSHALQEFSSGFPSSLKQKATNELNAILNAGESFTCVAPIYSNDLSSVMPDNQCFNLEEGLGIMAQTENFSYQLHPITTYEHGKVPNCTAQGTCTFTGINDPLIGSFKTDSYGRWPQMCDYFTNNLNTQLSSLQSSCTAEANCTDSGRGANATPCNTSCPVTTAKVTAYLADIPCLCKWIYIAKQIASYTMFFTRTQTQYSYMKLPRAYTCSNSNDTVQDCTPVQPSDEDYQPAALTTSKCWRRNYHPFGITDLRLVTPEWPAVNFRSEAVLTPSTSDWWNVQHVLASKSSSSSSSSSGGGSGFSGGGSGGGGSGGGSSSGSSTGGGGSQTTQSAKASVDCNVAGTCWLQAAEGTGNLSFLATDCEQLTMESCFLSRMANFTGLSLGCISTGPQYMGDLSSINSATYNGQYNSKNPSAAQEYVEGFDFQDSTPENLRATVLYNDTTQISSGFGIPKWIRVSGPINAAIDAFLNAFTTPTSRIDASLIGLKEFPRAASILSVDLGSVLGPFLFTLAFNLLFPTVIVAIVYEKEMKLRVMMRMMGLGTFAYWVINYTFWFLIYAAFTFLFLLIACTVRLDSGYTLNILTRQEYSIHFVFFFLFINQTIAFALLWASVLRSSKVAQIGGTLWVLAMTVIAYTAWDAGNFFNTDSISTNLKNFITIWPIWNFYRGWMEYKEYASEAVMFARPGMQWSDIAGPNKDPLCAMGTVLLIMGLEWPIFLLISFYLDQVLDSGHRVPRHPLFCFFFKHNQHQVANRDQEADAGRNEPDDVRAEEARVKTMMEKPAEEHDAVTIVDMSKIYPAYLGNAPKVAVRTLTMGVRHGECFGMLGPNGAGKSTTINMLVGFAQPTHGTAEIEGFDIRSDMDRIYSLMGVCPQHDILWETLTARQHMLFYGRLKNLVGPELHQAVTDGLKQVNLLHVIDEAVGTFSGGMKRRLSVAISMVGRPLCCYLDEPSTGLDPASRRSLWSCVKEAKRSRAIFLTTHSMEEAEGLCDRIGIFVDGALRCIGNPKEITARFGGYYTLTVTGEPGREKDVADLVYGIAEDVRITYAIGGTQKFEIPTSQATLTRIFGTITQHKASAGIRDWGVSNTTLEEVFIKVSRGATGT